MLFVATYSQAREACKIESDNARKSAQGGLPPKDKAKVAAQPLAIHEEDGEGLTSNNKTINVIVTADKQDVRAQSKQISLDLNAESPSSLEYFSGKNI